MKNTVVIAFLVLAVFSASCNLSTVNSADMFPQVFQEQVAKARYVEFSPDGRYFLAFGSATHINVWRVDDFFPYAKYRLVQDEPGLFTEYFWISSAGFTSDSKFVFALLSDGKVVLTNLDTSENTTYDPATLSESGMRTVLSGFGIYKAKGVRGVTADAKYLITLSYSNSSLEIEDLTTGKKKSWQPGSPYFTPTISNVAVSPDSDTIAVGLRTGEVRLYSIRQGMETGNLAQGEYSAYALFSPDGTMLLTSSSNDTLNLWVVETRTKIITWKKDGIIGPILWLRGTPWFAFGTSDGDLIIESTEKKKRIVKRKVFEDPISSIDYLPSKHMLLLCDIEGNIAAYKIPQHRQNR